MLTSLTINNLVVVSSADIEFRNGLTTITGETGSGKSVVIDALLLLMGEKGSAQLIRQNEDRADISAEFNIGQSNAVQQWLQAESLDTAENECLLRRVLVRNGRSRAFINGIAVPIAKLSELTSQLIDVHGQHAHQSLLKSHFQLQVLDKFGQNQALAKKVADTFRKKHALEKQLEELTTATDENSSKQQLLSFQINELQNLNLQTNEWQALDQLHKKLSNAQQLISGSAELLTLLDDADTSVSAQLGYAQHQLKELITNDDRFSEISGLLDEAQIAVGESIHTLKSIADKLELDPQALNETENRLSLLLDTARKYQIKPEQLGEHLADLEQQQAELNNSERDIQAVSEKLQKLDTDYQQRCQQLTKNRKKHALSLQKIITDSMAKLSMQGGCFAIEINDSNASASGIDKVEFMVSTNPGQDHHRLKETASGGELSRISLAIQVALSDKVSVPVLVFDEVDVGIGGKTAATVGQLLHTLGQHRQVICITHLPQVAAWSSQHACVEKFTKNNITETHIALLDEQQRIEELARMVGGQEITAQTLATAKEMIKQATDQ